MPATYRLDTGWNLIGLHSEYSRHVAEKLASLMHPQRIWASLLEYDNYIEFSWGKEEPPEIVLGSFRSLTETEDMTPGRGYWIYVSQPGVILP